MAYNQKSKMLAVLLLACGTGLAAERIPWPDETPPTPKVETTPRSLPSLFMWLYKNCISQVDVARTCRFTPTCGDYARETIARHGPWLGWLMGCERAIRYHGDTRTYRRTVIDGQTRLVDPVSDNDFWLPSHPKKKP